MKTGQRKVSRSHRISQRVIHRVAETIAAKFNPEQIILFGSYAYGKPHRYSDVDLLIILDTRERPLKKQIEIARALSPHPFGMDILVRTPQEMQARIALGDFYLRGIQDKGKVLYERARR